ncbi:MAG TPA: hypothetical protein VKU80_17215 [Planctomycetota bacterium]|nr:hypothetical protein [Planctomycetota bacterium]
MRSLVRVTIYLVVYAVLIVMTFHGSMILGCGAPPNACLEKPDPQPETGWPCPKTTTTSTP